MSKVELIHGDCLDVMPTLPANSVQGAIIDPPFGCSEFSSVNIQKYRSKFGGAWRQPRANRQPTPRFQATVDEQPTQMMQKMSLVAVHLLRICVPGSHVFIACSPLFQHLVTGCFVSNGWQMRTAIIRLVATLRGGDRPKNADKEFPDCTVLPRSKYEPWLVLRKPFVGTVAQNLRIYGTGALRRKSEATPFADVIASQRTPAKEKSGLFHPTVKPLNFIMQLMRAVIPGEGGTVIDCFAGSGTTAIAALRTGRKAICLEKDKTYYETMVKRVEAEQALRLKV